MADAYFIIFNLILSYLLPLLVIIICYIIIYKRIHSRNIPGELCPTRRRTLLYKSKIQIIKMLLIVILTFGLFWLPLYVLFVIMKFCGFPKTKMQEKIIGILFPLAQWLGEAHSSINPFIYISFSRKFRLEFKWLMKNVLKFKETPKQEYYLTYDTSGECILLSTIRMSQESQV